MFFPSGKELNLINDEHFLKFFQWLTDIIIIVISEKEYYEGVGKRVNYQEVTPCLKGVKKLWRQLLDTDLWKTIKLDRKILIRSVRDGVPKEMRGDIWKLLILQNKLHQNGNVEHQEFNNNISNKTTSDYDALHYDLLKNQLTSHQHAILIDLGRTFPSHPFFSSAAGPGQASLFNVLKAYSVLDAEVGYCQGLSFVAGVILIHVNERDAFDVLKYIMFELGFRRHYRPDMVPLQQVSMYQLTRMLHDSYKDLFDHFDANQIAPTLYAAPWFLTIFASQFPLGFVARVFDLILMHGTEVIIKVALVLLDNHRELIKQCSSFESLVEFLKITLPDMAIIQMEKIFNQVYSMDITRCLEAYEMEYHILHEEISRPIKNSSQIDDCDKILTSLRRQKMELLEQLQIARRQILSLEEENCFLSNNQMKLKSQNQILELERTALLKMIDQMNNKNEVNPNPEKSEELITNMHSSSGENVPLGI
ncbi:hypothetical protein HELRODRAFT_63519 [Helobdella robusta]|uniref:Rab-GAP TBC domain-containing protein n=1 Tax=Helobdella robusta TaxID=6412 RepID=T1FXG8_HELRO|nr:hypothetical protein HELRODRAFT_63519 [Helobdella robusta]ESO12536.1 hypothetical protein HELRODRAFT_63519 [Helobdella robusta]